MTTKEFQTNAVCVKALEDMAANISKKLDTDKVYLHDEKDARELRERYEVLPLPNCYKWIINDFYSCTCSKLTRVIELAYLAGMEAAMQVSVPQAV